MPLLLPLSLLPQRVAELDPNQSFYLHCKSDVRSLKAVKFRQEHGFKPVKSVRGGISAWSDQGATQRAEELKPSA